MWRHKRTHKPPAGKMNIINQPIALSAAFLFQAFLTTDFTPHKLSRIFAGLPLHRSPLPCSTLRLPALSWESGAPTQKQKHRGCKFKGLSQPCVSGAKSDAISGSFGADVPSAILSRSVTSGPGHAHQLEEQQEPGSLTTWRVQPMGSRSQARMPLGESQVCKHPRRGIFSRRPVELSTAYTTPERFTNKMQQRYHHL